MTPLSGGADDLHLPCPFCGCALVANTNQEDLYVRRYGTHWQHPESNCHLSDHEVGPGDAEEWNRRAPIESDRARRQGALTEVVRKFLADNDPEGFGCACTPTHKCGPCSWTDRVRPLVAALSLKGAKD